VIEYTAPESEGRGGERTEGTRFERKEGRKGGREEENASNENL
jgi:hypothetical protein